MFAASKPASAEAGDWRTRLMGWDEAFCCAERSSMSISRVSLKYCEL